MPIHYSQDEPSSVRDLPREVVTFIIPRPVEHWDYRARDGRYQLVQTAPDEYPEPGGSWSYGHWDEASPDEATHVLINYTGWSDYSGSGVERSNYRSLLRDYPDTFTDVWGGYGTRQLMLAVDWQPPEDGREGLLSELAGLADYPLYDEEDHSMLEMEAADEAWNAYLHLDVERDLIDRSESPEAMEDMLDTLPEDTLSRMFYETLGDQPAGPYLETATDVVFPYYDDSISVMADQLWERRCEASRAAVYGQDTPELPEVTS